jgi:hypothetical protein
MTAARNLLASAILAILFCPASKAADWSLSKTGTNDLVWGAKGGLQFAIAPSGFRAPEPRGLIRLGYPVLTNGGYDLVNFIAVEPVVKSRKGYSELEFSKLDRIQGKRIWLLSQTAGADKLNVRLGVERFENGAEVELEIQQRADAPNEIAITTHGTPNGAEMEFCILTATMGNMTRSRELWLRNRVARAKELYPDYQEDGFAPHTSFAADQLLSLNDGSLLAAIATDEKDPASTIPFPKSNFWHYRGCPVTQYWKSPASEDHNNLTVVVNARHTYYGSKREIPHGNAYENFEMRQPFKDGQQLVFGITRATPQELGFQK